MLVGEGSQAVGVLSEPFGQRLGNVGGPLVQGVRAVVELVGVLIGADDVAAAVDAVIEARGLPGDSPVTEGLFAPVVAEQENVRVVIEQGVFVGQQPPCCSGSDDRPGKPGCLGSGVDRASCGGAGDAPAGFEVVVEVCHGVGDRADGLDVDEFVDAVPAAGCVPLGDKGCPQVPVLDGQSDQPAGPTGDVPGQRPAEATDADPAVRVW